MDRVRCRVKVRIRVRVRPLGMGIFKRANFFYDGFETNHRSNTVTITL